MLAKLQSKLTTRCLGFTKAVAACCLLGIAANAFADRNPNPGVLPAG